MLRSRTRAAHEAVDRRYGGFDLGAASGYAAFLAAQAPALLATEGALATAGSADLLPDWPARRRGPAMLADFDRLDLARPVPPQLRLAGPDALFGAAYVLEGSRLGARLLSARVGPSVPAAATGFLRHGQGERLWPDFLAALDRHDARGADIETAGAAAEAVFGLFLDAGFLAAAESLPAEAL